MHLVKQTRRDECIVLELRRVVNGRGARISHRQVDGFSRRCGSAGRCLVRSTRTTPRTAFSRNKRPNRTKSLRSIELYPFILPFGPPWRESSLALLVAPGRAVAPSSGHTPTARLRPPRPRSRTGAGFVHSAATLARGPASARLSRLFSPRGKRRVFPPRTLPRRFPALVARVRDGREEG